MRDETYAFIGDVRDRKRTARGAWNRKGAKKGCTLPSDYLTPAQKRKLNGPCITVQPAKEKRDRA